MKILVLGGTGAMGSHLVDLLAARGDNVTVTSRRRRSSKGTVCFVAGNARTQKFLKSLMAEEWDAVVDFMVYSTSEFKTRVNCLLGSTRHYLYLSSARVYADSQSPIAEYSPRIIDVSSDDKYLATDEYALAKARQENILAKSFYNNWTIIRPYITYSSNRLQLGVLEKEDWLYRALHGRAIAISSDIQDKTTTLTHGKDVALGIASLIGHPETYGEAFHIAAAQSVVWSQVLDVYLEVLEKYLGRRPSVCSQELPEFILWSKRKYQIIYDRLYHRKFNVEKISRFVDTKTFVDPLTGLKQELERFLKLHPSRFNHISWRAEGVKDRLLNEHANFSEIRDAKNILKYLLFRYSGLGQF